MARERVVALVDMDCFYVQVEQRLDPSLRGKPCAVVQYNSWKGGAIIAVGYEARKFGVTRNMRGDEAKEKCPDIILAKVPEARGKADLTRYREAGAEVIQALQIFCNVCERASVDEAYLDLTKQVESSLDNITLEKLAEETLECSHIIGFTDLDTTNRNELKGLWLAALSDEHNKCLAMGALIVQKAREAIREKTGFSCSAGIGHNKVMAKLAGGSHKPNQQTILPHQSVATFFAAIPIGKVRFFGGKFGKSVMSLLQVEKMSELTKFSEEQLRSCFGVKSGSWLYQMCRGIEHEAVRSRQLPKSTGCGKNFTGKMKLVSKEKVCYWMMQLAEELNDRIKGEERRNQRTAKLVSVGLRTENNTSCVRSFALRSSDPKSVCDSAMQVIKTFNTGTGDVWHPAVVSLSLSASKFDDTAKYQGSSSISSFFAKKELTADSENSLGLTEEDLLEDSQTDEEGETNDKQGIVVDKITKEGVSQPTIKSCFSNAKNEEHTPIFTYDRDEIDPLVVDELPEDLRNEMLTFLGNQKTAEKNKRCSNGIQKCTDQDRDTENLLKTNRMPFTRVEGIEKSVAQTKDFMDSSTGHVESNSDKFEQLVQCSQCSRKLSPSEMTEHLDFHFAMELQKTDQVNENLRKTSPPRKRQKSTIHRFFVTKQE